MSMQDVFYLLGSIYLLLGIIVLLVILFGSIYVIRKFNKFQSDVKKRLEQEISDMREKPKLLAGFIAHFVAKGIKNSFKNRER